MADAVRLDTVVTPAASVIAATVTDAPVNVPAVLLPATLVGTVAADENPAMLDAVVMPAAEVTEAAAVALPVIVLVVLVPSAWVMVLEPPPALGTHILRSTGASSCQMLSLRALCSSPVSRQSKNSL